VVESLNKHKFALQNQAKNTAFNHRFYNLFSDIFSGTVLKQAYRLGQLAKLQVEGRFTQNSAIDNTKVKTEDTFVENKNLTTKTEIASDSLLKQAYRLGQLAKLQVGGLFTKSSISNNKQKYSEQYGRFLPICAKDTPHFGSDVYKLGTRARKAQADVKNFIQGTLNVRSVGQMRSKFLTTCTIKGTRGGNLQADVLQYGRSMIEMLGVLAIIGVLSVGGIAGYSKAMMKVKINKTVSQMSQMVSNIHTLYKSQSSYEGLNNNIMKKAKLVPDEVWVTGGDGYSRMYNPFEDIYWVNATGKDTDTDYKAFLLQVYAVPQEACIELATLDWGTAIPELRGIGIGAGNEFSCPTCSCNNSAACIKDLPVTVEKAANYCGSSEKMSFLFE
jgi:type II secretory pathway pseudopilin PulG